MSLRLRLTLAFSVSMAVVLSAFGAFLYVRLGAELMAKIDLELRTRGDTIVSAVSRRQPVPLQVGGGLIDPDEAFAQVLSPSGEILDTAPAVAAAPMLTTEALRSVSKPTFLTRRVGGVNDPARLLADRVSPGAAGEAVVVVGATLGDRQEALHRLLLLLAIGGPVALLGASAAGWAVAGVALRPVERIRREAAAISVSDPDRRLPVPDTGDELSRLARTLNDMLVRLSDASEREHRFVDDASHELRTPLAILKVELDLAQTRTRSREELEGVVKAASAETDRLVRLAQDLLVLARTRRGRLRLAAESIDLKELLAQTVEPFTRGSGMSPPIELTAFEGEARVDPARVRQAVQNLLDNATRHGRRPSGEACSIKVTAERDHGFVRIEVTDTGPGFSPEILDRAFEPFTRGPLSGEPGPSGEPGAGLGLAIVKAVAEAHGGHVTAENTQTGGARVVLVLSA